MWLRDTGQGLVSDLGHCCMLDVSSWSTHNSQEMDPEVTGSL